MENKGLSANNYIVFILRIILVYLLYAVCRIIFYCYNKELFGTIPGSEWIHIFRGAFVFDSASIFYINLPFIFLSLIPFYFREKKGWQALVGFFYVVPNAAGLLVNLGDVFYYPFKLARIASDDIRYLGEDNIGNLMGSFLHDYWWGAVVWLAMIFVLYRVGCRFIRLKPGNRFILSRPLFYILQWILLGITGGFAVFAIRGFTLSKASFPINVSDATLFVKPAYSSLILSNPFCLIRTIHKQVRIPVYFSEQEVKTIYSPIHAPSDSVTIKLDRPNIMLLVLESFGSAHFKSLSDQWGDKPSCTPFLDSLFNHGLLFTHAYQSGKRSIDALPAIWASIPSFREDFMALPQSIGSYHALPAILKEQGYHTSFFHGATRSSMSFVAFGQMAGVEHFVSREDYEAANGSGDFDGKWGIWDHKFLPFVAQELSRLPQPFFATLFTLSSHHPFALPPGMENDFYDNPKAEIEKTIAYSDRALRDFFRQVRQAPWFENTLFIITADHGSGADNAKYLSSPYSHAVPVFYYMPGNPALPVKKDSVLTAHVDIMPTVLGFMDYKKPYFSFGRDAVNSEKTDRFVVDYMNGVYGMITDSLLYQFDGEQWIGIFDYRSDYAKRHDLRSQIPENEQSAMLIRLKGYLQQYYQAIDKHTYKE